MWQTIAIVSFGLTFTGLYFYRKINLEKKICLGVDINKKDKPMIAEGAGIILLFGLVSSIAITAFFTKAHFELLMLLAAAVFFSAAGFFDDLKNKFKKKPLTWTMRALPIGAFSIAWGFLLTQNIALAVVYGLFLAVIASFQNTFAGLNGWEVGSGLIISLFTAYLVSDSYLFLPAIGLSFSILALLLYNFYPAKLFPGDAGTLLIGSAIAATAILSKNTQTMITISLFFLPHLIDLALKFFTNPKDMTQQKNLPYRLLENNKLEIPDPANPKLDFAKLIIKILGPMSEKKIVLIIWVIVIANCLAWTVIFRAF